MMQKSCPGLCVFLVFLLLSVICYLWLVVFLFFAGCLVFAVCFLVCPADFLEIVSPGGMRDGRQIQNLDVSHVSSNRRNPVIADIFSRLEYAERRGSGLSRIRDSFDDALDVRFSSDDAVFVVCMRNQNWDDVYSDTAHPDVEEALLSVEDVLLDRDNALSSGEDVLLETNLLYTRLSVAYPNLSGKTHNRVLELFSRFGYDASFGRCDIEEVFGVQWRRASTILQRLVLAGVVVHEKRDTYRFCR